MSRKSEIHKNIVLVALTRLGDLLQASPMIAGLKQENPGAHIAIIVDKNFAGVCHGIPGIDEIIEMDMAMLMRSLAREKDGIVDAYAFLDQFVESIQQRNFDFCINMSSSAYTSLLTTMLRAKTSRGWTSDERGHRLITTPWQMLFAAYVYHSNRQFNSINFVDIMRCAAGVETHPKQLLYQVADSDRLFPARFFEEEGLPADGPLICLQVGASQVKRQWAPQKFAELCKLLVENLNARIVLTGTKSELPIINTVHTMYESPRIISAAGKTSLGELSALLEHADVLITGDTGPMHLAVAVGTPTVALFLASAYCFETGPYSEGNIIIQPQITCNPCNPNYSCRRPDCHEQMTPWIIYSLTKMRLETPRGEEHTMRVSSELVPPQIAQVYVTTFDEYDFLEFRPLNGTAGKDGYPDGFLPAVRAAYRKLWIEELTAAEPRALPSTSSSARLPVVSEIEGEVMAGAQRAVELVKLGNQAVSKLIELINDVQSPPQMLGQINQVIEQISSEIEDLGHSYPVLGAVSRMFVMEKENLRGEDPLVLASKMGGIYASFGERVQKFERFYKYYLRSMRGETRGQQHKQEQVPMPAARI